MGSACSEFICAPLQTQKSNDLINRLSDLKAVLQSCTSGADACTNTIQGLNQLIADLDTAILFAQAGTLYDSSINRPVSPKSISIQQKLFHGSKEAIMQAEKAIVEHIQSLVIRVLILPTIDCILLILMKNIRFLIFSQLGD